MKKTTKLWIAFLLMALTMGLTWFFSSSTGEDSNEFSYQISDAIMIFVAQYVDVRENDLFWQENLNWIIRKIGHMGEYFLLGIFSLTFFDIWLEKFRYAIPSAFVTCLVWASADEFRQRFVNGRTGQLFDIGVDMVGVAIGILLTLLVLHISHTMTALKSKLLIAEAKLQEIGDKSNIT